MFIVNAFKNTFGNIGAVFSCVGMYLKLIGWDLSLSLLNALGYPLFLYRKPGQVTPKGAPGFGGKWPEYIPPKDTDSRSACPMLNAMANHGVFSRLVPFILV